MSIIRFSSKMFNNTDSQAYIYFSVHPLPNNKPRVVLYVNETMTEEEYIGFVQRLANDLLKRKMITIEEITND